MVNAVVIDTHVHLYPPEIIKDRARISEREEYFRILSSSRVHKWGTAEELIAAMDVDGVDESWVFGFAFHDVGLCRLCNDYVIDSASRFAGRLKPLAVVPPLAAGAEREIQRCAELGVAGVGELFPDGQSFNVDDIRETWRLVGACHENGLFLLLHASEPVGHLYPGKGSIGPKELYRMASNHPELVIVLAHMGGGLFVYEQMPEVKKVLANVWYDTAALPFLYAPSILNTAIASGVGDKLLYGSDYPLLGYPRYKKMFEASGITDGDTKAILCGNAKRLLQMNSECS